MIEVNYTSLLPWSAQADRKTGSRTGFKFEDRSLWLEEGDFKLSFHDPKDKYKRTILVKKELIILAQLRRFIYHDSKVD